METTEGSQTYGMSEGFIKKTKRTYYLLYIFIPIGMILSFYLLAYTRGKTPGLFFLDGFFIGVIIFIELEIFIVARIMVNKIKSNTLTVGTNFIQRTSKVQEVPIYFNDITKLEIKRDSKGMINIIHVVTPTANVNLCGFEHLDDVATLLSKEATLAQIKETKNKIDYNHPLFLALIFFATILMISFAQNNLSLPLEKIISILFSLFLIIFKPISKAQGKRFRALEIICGGIILFSQLILLFH